MERINIETDFIFGGKEDFDFGFLVKLNKCALCNIANDRTSEIPFTPEGPLSASIALIHPHPTDEDVLETGYFNVNKKTYRNYFEFYLKKMGICSKNIYITSSLFCCPNYRRKPSSVDINMCLSHKYEEFQYLSNLKCIILMGDITLKQILSFDLHMRECAGSVYFEKSKNLLFIPIYHFLHYFFHMTDSERENTDFILYNIKNEIGSLEINN
jgi:uracil-DNA glycosylase family 4